MSDYFRTKIWRIVVERRELFKVATTWRHGRQSWGLSSSRSFSSRPCYVRERVFVRVFDEAYRVTLALELDSGSVRCSAL